MNRRTYIRARGAIGLLLIGLGAYIVVEISHDVGFRFEALPGIVLGAAMVALGFIRVRAALAVGKAPPP